MRRYLVWSSLAVLTLACSDPVGPDMTGRWVSPSVELVITPVVRRFTYGCNRPVLIPRDAGFDSTGHIVVGGNLTDLAGWDTFTFYGTLIGDTIVATMSLSSRAGATTWNFTMQREGSLPRAPVDCGSLLGAALHARQAGGAVLLRKPSICEIV